ncbi:MAG: formimidoylglutamase [Hydrogenophaga sp.]
MPHHAPTPWTGRNDHEDSAAPERLARWHHRVAPWHGQAQSGVVLIGFAVDEGVRRNQGRTGAASGPAALRSALANLPAPAHTALWDAGTVHCEAQALEAAQAELSATVAQVRAQGGLPLVMGGGHEIAWGTFGGLVREGRTPGRLLVLNLDAHFDLRHAAAPNSGTPFAQIHQWCSDHQQPFAYTVLGISRFANTPALFDRARDTGTRWCLDEALQTPADWAQAQAELAHDLQACDAVYLTICLDVLNAAVAPGVSAPAAMGVPMAFIEAVIEQVKASDKLIAADMAELNPSFDRDGQTARVGARLLARVAGLPG